MGRASNDRWGLTPESLAQLLARLDPDAEKAAREYEVLRQRLIDFFDWRGAASPDELADETIDRVARKLAEGETIEHLRAFACGVARNVYLECGKARARQQRALRDHNVHAAPEERDADEAASAALERCLEHLSEADRTTILGYYRGAGNVHLDSRQPLADRLGISYQTLKTRAHRIRARLWRCVLQQMQDGAKNEALRNQ